jgi:hypothetical protein
MTATAAATVIAARSTEERHSHHTAMLFMILCHFWAGWPLFADRTLFGATV